MARLEMTCGEAGECAPRAACESAYLVGVHVALRAAPGLEDDERELVDELARDDLRARLALSTRETNFCTHIICGCLDGSGNLGIEAVARVHDRRGLLQHAKGLDQGRRQPFGGAANIEIQQGSSQSLSDKKPHTRWRAYRSVWAPQ